MKREKKFLVLLLCEIFRKAFSFRIEIFEDLLRLVLIQYAVTGHVRWMYPKMNIKSFIVLYLSTMRKFASTQTYFAQFYRKFSHAMQAMVVNWFWNTLQQRNGQLISFKKVIQMTRFTFFQFAHALNATEWEERKKNQHLKRLYENG